MSILRVLFMLVVALAAVPPVAARDAATDALKTVDTSSPRATLNAFLEASDEASRAYELWEKEQTEANRQAIEIAVKRMKQTLDLREVPLASRDAAATESALLLWEVLARMKLPANSRIPSEEEYKDQVDDQGNPKPASWALPETEIIISRVVDPESDRLGEFLFEPKTVAQAGQFYQKVRELPYQRKMSLQNPVRIYLESMGNLAPPTFAESLPEWTKIIFFGQVLWKWFAVVAMLLLALLIIILVLIWAVKLRSETRLTRFLRRFSIPIVMIVLMVWIARLAENYIRTTGSGTVLVHYVTLSLIFLGLAWAAWLTANSIGEAILLSRAIRSGSVDAHLIRLVVRVVGIVAATGILLYGASILGVPVNGLIAGVSIGSLAIALAAQSTLENFVGSLSLYADSPIRAGDFFQYGDELGTVEEIGLRSTRIRGIDRTVKMVPNSVLSRQTIINYTRRDRILFKHIVQLRYETKPDQMRYVLNALREILLAHPMVAGDPARARLVAMNAYSFDVELFAYVTTRDFNEFLAVQEDLILRIAQAVEDAGSSFAFPSQTTYLSRDVPPDAERTAAAEAAIARLREAGRLPFPNPDAERARELHNTGDYPPKGSTQASSS